MGSQEKSKIVLAVVSPNQNAYSETFIQAHRNIPGVDVKFYYEGFCPAKLDGKDLLSLSFNSRIYRKIKHVIWQSDLIPAEEALFNSFKKEKVSCVLAEYGPTGVAVLKVCKRLHLPLIVNFYGFDSSVTSLINKYKDRYIKMFDYASYVGVVSKTMEQQLIDIGCAADKIIYNPAGPGNDYFNVVPDYHSQQLIAVSRFVDKKAPYYTILAFKKIHDKFPDARLVMVGDGPLLNTCENLVKFFKLEHKVTFPGPLSPPDLKEQYRKSRAFLQHSITASNGDMEGTPVAILEAGAAGLPVISTRHSGIRDVVIENESGYLSDEHDVDSMSDHMSIILADGEKAKKVGMYAKDHIRTNFTTDHHLSKLAGLIHSLA